MRATPLALSIAAVPLVVLAAVVVGPSGLTPATLLAQTASAGRPEGPCDLYAAAGDPCVAAHSTTRALYAAYDGPLYQVLRQSDGKTLDIGVVRPADPRMAGGYANASAQDAFCANTFCWITTIYDQSPKHNHLTQAPRGGFSGPAMGGFNNLPLADMAPVTVLGHKVYGVFIEPGMGLRNDAPAGTAVDDQAEGQYWVINGRHFNAGCCFDYGNAETDSRDDGNGTMETTYFGDASDWFHGTMPGPWVMTDQENNLVGCVNADPSKLCSTLPNIDWRFVTAMAKGEPHHWTSLGGDAQRGPLAVMFDGGRVNPSYDPMRKQGAILLGNGGDNSNGSQGTFYEGAMTAAGTFPTDATDQKIQANVVAAKYEVAPLSFDKSVMTFRPSSRNDVGLAFTNASGAAISAVEIRVAGPATWPVAPASTNATLAAGETFKTTVAVTSGAAAFNGDLLATARWVDSTGGHHAETAVAKIRNVSPVTINEFQIGAGAPANGTNAFIELFNAGTAPVDLSGWTVTSHAILQPVSSAVTVPAGTKLAGGKFYLLGLATSGLSAAARKGDSVIYLRSTTGLTVGDPIEVGPGKETRTITAIGSPAGNSTTLWQPLPDGPVITVPVGSMNVPVTSVTGFVVGEHVAIGYGATYPVVGGSVEHYEVATVTAIGRQGTQGRLSAAAPAGSTVLKVSNIDNISAGDTIRLDIPSVGHGVESVTVSTVGTAGTDGTGLTLTAPLKFTHASNMPFSDRGTGITFTPATAHPHSSNEPVQPLGSGVTLDRALSADQPVDAAVRDGRVTTAGYQGAAAPDQWFGGPTFSTNAGSLVLRDAAGLVVDSLNYGGLVDPWAAKGYQGTSGPTQSGCRAPAPTLGRGGAPQAGAVPTGFNRSAGRFPDGADTDSNCVDFLTQAATTLPAAAEAGATTIKVASVTDFSAGEAVIVGMGADAETVVIATVGTPGATTLTGDAAPGATTVTVAGIAGFSRGQTVTIDSGANAETVTVAMTGRNPPPAPGAQGTPSVTFTAPLSRAHQAGAQVSGSGMTLAAPLTRAHAIGTPVATNIPTPGAPNTYVRPKGGSTER